MAVLNRQQVQEIVNTRPKDMSEEDAIRDIISRGHSIEGLSAPATGNATPNIMSQENDPLAQLGIGIGATANSTPTTGVVKPTMVGNFGRAIIQTPMRIASGLQVGVEGAYAAVSPNFSMEDIGRRNVEGRDYGLLGKNIKPFGYQASEIQQKRDRGEQVTSSDILKAGGRMIADVGAGAAEIASYAIAPMAIKSPGFIALLKNTAGVSALTSASSIGQSIDRGDSLPATIGKGVASYVATTGTFGLMRFGGNLFNKYGGRLVQDDVVRNESERLNKFTEDFIRTNPEIVDDYYRNNPSQFVSLKGGVFKEEFEKRMEATRNASIDTLIPNVDNERLVTHNLYRSLGENAGNRFRNDADPLYKQVHNLTSRTEGTPETDKEFNAVLNELGFESDKAGRVVINKAKQDELIRAGKFEEINSVESQQVIQFLNSVNAVKEGGLTISEVLNVMERSHTYLAEASPAQAKAINGIVEKMREDVRNLLPKEDIELWDNAHAAWQMAKTVYNNPTLDKAKNSGFADYYVDAIVKLKPSPERDALVEVLKNNKKPAQDLMIHTVLKRAKQMSNEDANKYIDDFLKATRSYEGGEQFLDAQQREMLTAFRDFTSQDFRTSVVDIQKNLGLQPEEYTKFINDIRKVKIFDKLNSGEFDNISENFNYLVKNEPDKLNLIIEQFDDTERQILGTTLVKDMLEKRNITLVPDPKKPGQMMVSDNFMETYEKMFVTISEAQKRTGSDSLYGMFTPTEMAGIHKAFQDMQEVQAIINSEGGRNQFYRATSLLTSLLYAKLGYITGAARNLQKAIGSEVPQEISASQKDVQAIILKWYEEGKIPPDTSIPGIVDKLNAYYLAAPSAGSMVGDIGDNKE